MSMTSTPSASLVSLSTYGDEVPSSLTLSTFRVHHEEGILTMEARHRHDLIAKLHEKHPDLRIIAIAVIINSVPHYFHK